MAVVLRLMRAGAKKRPFYRIVAADSRRQRDGRFIEILGFYDPMANPASLKVEQDKVSGWLANGAQPSEQVASLLRKVGMKPTVGVKPAKAAAAEGAAGTPAPKAKKKAAAKKAARRVPRKASARKTEKKAAKKKAAKKSAKK